ncbi:MAG: DUF1080 domain-containing protein [Planctomycetaceae bacterium]|jgi:HEAT repeat protein|nr:DUF1080 domain-containing protein [Planctomycetaceae bacterium]
MKKIIVFVSFVILFASSFALAKNGQPSDVETEKNIKILREIFKDQNSKPSNDQLHEAAQAIFNLTQIGTDNTAPELGKLLNRNELNTVVRTALVNIGDAGVDVLRKSIDSLDGNNLAGVIESLGAVRDEGSVDRLIILTKSDNEVVAKSAILALGKIASPKAILRIRSILRSRQTKYHRTAAVAVLSAAEGLIGEETESAIVLLNDLRRRRELTATWSAATETYILLNEKEGINIFARLLMSNDELSFRTARNVALKIKSPRAIDLIVNYLETVNVRGGKRILLIETLGAMRNSKALPVLIRLASSKDAKICVAAIRALGKIGEMGAFDVIFAAIDSADKDVAIAAKESLTKLQGKEFNATIIRNLDSTENKLRLIALGVIGERRIAEAAGKVKSLFNDSDVAIRVAAYRAFSQMIVAAPSDLELLLGLFQKGGLVLEDERAGLREALVTVCRKIPARDESVEVIEKFKDNSNVKTKELLMDLLYYIGNKKAVKVVAEFARDKENDVVDYATMLMGKWSTSEVAPYLLELAGNHPLEKYRVRTLSGYLRVIRQFGLPLEQKFEMIEKAEVIAKREADKKRVAEIKGKIQNQLKAKPIFDGKTFEGWEGNLSYFRIKDGAIVAGTMEKRIPRNEFLCTKKEYGNFTLHLEIKVIGKDANAGVQFRSKRLTEDKKRPNEVAGYQADMTDTAKYWGNLYDEARRNKFLAEANLDEVKKVFRQNDWNELKIVCKDNNIKLYVNGILTADYNESDETIPKTGIIGLQIHSGNPSEAWYRNIRIE